jgi:hypothetical protein
MPNSPTIFVRTQATEKPPLTSIEEVVVPPPISTIGDCFLTGHSGKDDLEMFGVFALGENPDDFLHNLFCEILWFLGHDCLPC